MEFQNSNRPSRDQLYIAIARLIATRGTCMRGKVGCVICRDSRIISTGYNGPPKGTLHCSPKICDIKVHCERAIHAEANAISFAAKEGISTNGATLYCTHSPCSNCAKLIIQAGILRVVYETLYDDKGLNLLNEAGIEICKYEDNI